MADSPKYLRLPEVCERYGLSERHIRDLMTARKIPFYKLGHRTLRFDPDELDQWFADQHVEAID